MLGLRNPYIRNDVFFKISRKTIFRPPLRLGPSKLFLDILNKGSFLVISPKGGTNQNVQEDMDITPRAGIEDS